MHMCSFTYTPPCLVHSHIWVIIPFAGYNSEVALFKISKNSWLWHAANMVSITVTFKERQKAKIGYVSSLIWRCCVNFWKAIVGFYCFYRCAAVAHSHGFIKDRCTMMSSRSISDVLTTETFTEEQLKASGKIYNTPWHKCEIQNSTIGSQSIHKCECELNWHCCVL